jgi:LacI family transcriptional regulator
LSKRPTIADLAQKSGVSVATVDRVLNGRHPVREETSRRVYEAATALGFHATSLIRQRIHGDLPQYRLGFLLQKPTHEFYRNFGAEIEAAVSGAQNIRAVTMLNYVEDVTPANVVKQLKEMAPRVQAIALTSVDHPNVTAAVAEIRERGIPVFSLLSDFAIGVRTGYIGVDNRKAGRVAAWTIAKTASHKGKIAVFVGSHRYLGHDLREIGFRTYFREHAPQFQLLDTLVNLEETRFTYEATIDLITRHKDLAGFYVAGGGMEGAIEALREMRVQDRITAVCNELTADSRAALADHVLAMTISTPLKTLAERLVEIMTKSIASNGAEMPSQQFLPFDLHVSENI